MEQRSHKSIKGYLLGWSVLLLLLLGGLFALERWHNHYRVQQLSEMKILYPGQEVGLQENFDYYGEIVTNSYIGAAIILSVILTVSVGMVYWWKNRYDAQTEQWSQDNYKRLLDQLARFQKGDYAVEPLIPVGDNAGVAERQWNDIWNQVRELGYYFEGLREQLEHEENSTKALIADISHQLKTPLASLRMSHDLAQEEQLSAEERREFLEKEEFEIHRLELLMQELMHLSRLENHMIQISAAECGIRETITEAVNLVFMKAHAKQMELQINLEEDIEICHDRKWTVEAIANVLDNAIKYSKTGTNITVTVQTLPNLLLMDIEDEGIGIPSEELHKIFKRFYRGQEASQYAKEGAGIGLYLTRRILEQQGGTIVAKRKQQGGTVFRITFPLRNHAEHRNRIKGMKG